MAGMRNLLQSKTVKGLILAAVIAAILGTSGCREQHTKPGTPEMSQIVIIISKQADPKEEYAAKELQRYLYQLTGSKIEIESGGNISSDCFVIGTTQTNKVLAELAQDGHFMPATDELTDQGYVLKTLTVDGGKTLIITATDPQGVLYGVYGLLDDYYNIGFYMGGDVIPTPKRALEIVNVDERKRPRQHTRGMLPWTNFPQSATVYSFEDYRFVLDQMAKMRMNLLHIHNYNMKFNKEVHKEMFHNWSYKGHMPRCAFATARTGHGWACPGWDVNKYLFGADALFDDYDFGSDATLHNDSLSNVQVYDKGRSLFKKVIEYAHKRGIKIALGIDIDIVPQEFKTPADNPEMVEARINQLIEDYPQLDVLLCFQSEGIHQDKKNFDKWHRIFDQMYKTVKEKAPQIKIGISGWGLSEESAKDMPEDVIAAPIAHYSASFEDGSIYHDREFWACPWLERDFHSSQYYYPYDINLSDTIKSYAQRKDNLKGLYCLTWRLTDAVDAKMSYIAKAPWDLDDKYDSSYDVYYEYAKENYGEKFAEAITEIINENEPFASGFAECMPTPEFSGSNRPSGGGYLLNIDKLSISAPDGVTTEIQAEDHTENKGTQHADRSGGGKCVGYIKHGDWIKFDNVPFGMEPGKITAVVASATKQGGDIQIRLDSPTGPELGLIEVKDTGGWQSWKEFSIEIEQVAGEHDVYLMFLNKPKDDSDMARKQLEVIDECIQNCTNDNKRRRLEMLRCRIQAALDHIMLDQKFPYVTWQDLPHRFESWAQNFMYRINDISSLGNIMSTQTRFVQLRYTGKIDELRKDLEIQPPGCVKACGTNDGAIVTWKNEQTNVTGFNVYRDGQKLNKLPLAPASASYRDTTTGIYNYTVTSISADGDESMASIPDMCMAGNADNEKPEIVVISPPTSVYRGQSFEITARVMDNRCNEQITANFYYRPAGAMNWRMMPMQRRTKAIFTASFEPKDNTTLYEYYIKADDGKNTSLYPRGAKLVTNTFVVLESSDNQPPSPLEDVRAKDGKITWRIADEDTYWIKIYRDTKADFEVGPASYVTYVYRSTDEFEDKSDDFAGRKLDGRYYYRLTAVDKNGNQSPASRPIKISY